jgi:hypothetical protein
MVTLVPMKISKLADKFAMKLSLEPRPGFTADLPEDLSPYEPTLKDVEPVYTPPEKFLSQPKPIGAKDYLDPIKAKIHLLDEKIAFGSLDEALDLIFDAKYNLELLAKHLVNKQKKQKKNASEDNFTEEDELLQEQRTLQQLIDEELGKEDTSTLDLLQGRLYEVQKRLYKVQSGLYSLKSFNSLLAIANKFANTLPYDAKFFNLDTDTGESEEGTIFHDPTAVADEPVHLPAILKEHIKYLSYMDIEQLRNERRRLKGIARTFAHAPPYLLQKRLEEVDKLIASYNSRYF